MNTKFSKILLEKFPQAKMDYPLTQHTTIGVGGPANYFFEVRQVTEFIDALKLVHEYGVPVRILGCGSNVVISDRGIDGLVILNRIEHFQVLDEKPPLKPKRTTGERFKTIGESYYTTEGLHYSDEQLEPVLVRIGSGARVIPLMKKLFETGITGLQWYAGIPASVGGAIFMNMHGGAHFFGDLVYRCRLFDGKTDRWEYQHYFQFDYDWSVLHQTREVILEADLVLSRGDVLAAKKLSVDWARRKSVQPQKTAGCVFQNLTENQQKQLALPTPSIGYLLDEKLGLKGHQIGGARISENHAAFIENAGSASARDVYQLVQFIKNEVHKKYSIDLKLEIEFIGDFE